MEEEKEKTLEEVVDNDQGIIYEIYEIHKTLINLYAVNISAREEFEPYKDIFPKKAMKKQIAVLRRRQRQLFDGLWGWHEGE